MGKWPSTNITRDPYVAGKFYSVNKEKLRKELIDLFGTAKSPEESNLSLRALIAPHAGYIFSGEVAASSFNQILENASYKRVFVIASSHQMFFNGASVYTQGDYKTPLGVVKVDRNLGKKLVRENDVFSDNIEPHNFEHSLEVQLPFLQHKLGNDFLLVPIILGTQFPDDCKQIAHVLTPYFNDENLFIVSTDFSHYPEYRDAVQIDTITSNAILSNNTEELLSSLKKNKKKNIDNLATSLCGWTSVLTLMYLTLGNSFNYKKIAYQNSGDIPIYGDRKRVVGYHAIAIYAKEDSYFDLSANERHYLLEVARHSLENQLNIKNNTGVIKIPDDGKMSQHLGAFVSLYVNNELRGCIGNVFGQEPLIEIIKRMAVAASRDRRFMNISHEDMDVLNIEISVLSPLKQVYSIDEVVLGKHGIYIEKGHFSGTFLPQVANKMNWTIEEFLGHCSRDKAGLEWDGWKDASVYIYEAEVFSENSL